MKTENTSSTTARDKEQPYLVAAVLIFLNLGVIIPLITGLSLTHSQSDQSSVIAMAIAIGFSGLMEALLLARMLGAIVRRLESERDENIAQA